jgi:hypothetical protein
LDLMKGPCTPTCCTLLCASFFCFLLASSELEPLVIGSVGYLFSNAMNQEQGYTIVKDKGPSSSEALLPLGFNDHWTKVMKDMPSSCYK